MATRELIQEGVQWRIHEADAAQVPGARRDHCLIFDSDGIVRRVWAYPPNWLELSDEHLWSLLSDRPVELPPVERADIGADARTHPDVADATADLARTRQLGQRVSSSVTERCSRHRERLRLAIHGYAETLRRNGVPPERAVVLIKAAMREGIGAMGGCDETEEEEIVGQGVAWGIESYFAT